MSKKFTILHDLSPLSESDRTQYLAAASEHFGLDPDLNALDAIWMDGGDGARRLIPYARRGTTDLLREIHGIEVVNLEQHDGPGYVSFKATGKTRSGRQEIAVGAAATEGLRGDKLAAAIATGQTRALRRLTLQSIGGGILDESEVQGVVSDISRSGASLASLATIPAPIQPSQTPNTQPGKDITPVMQQNPPKEGVSLQSTAALSGTSSLAAALVSAQTSSSPKPLMIAPEPFSSGSIIPTDTVTMTADQVAAHMLIQIEPAPEPAKTRRPRRTKAQMDAARGVISLDSPVSTVVENPLQTEEEKIAEIVGVPVEQVHKFDISPTEAENMLKASLPKISPDPVLAVNPDMPTAAEVTAWKAKLSAYTERQTGILAQGGMTENVFGKIRLYTMKLFPDAVVLPSKAIMLTNIQWKTLLDTFNQSVHEAGPVGLVRVIEDAAK